MKHEGGAAKAIANKAGEEFHEECKAYIGKYGELGTGEVMSTSAGGELKCMNVIHAVGPNWQGKNPNRIDKEKGQLRECVENIMKEMTKKGYKSVSVPAISTGIFKFPLELCSMIMGKTIKERIDYNPREFEGRRIIMCNFDTKNTDAFKNYFLMEFKDEYNDEDDED